MFAVTTVFLSSHLTLGDINYIARDFACSINVEFSAVGGVSEASELCGE